VIIILVLGVLIKKTIRVLSFIYIVGAHVQIISAYIGGTKMDETEGIRERAIV
jgi:hypothetical protein